MNAYSRQFRLLCLFAGLVAFELAYGAPVALVYEFVDGITVASGAARLLRDAGFEVRESTSFGPIDTSSVDLVVLGGFLSEKPGYDIFIQSQKGALQDFVSKGGVLLQFTTFRKTESTPAYLPAGLSIARADDDLNEIYALRPGHPLLAGIAFSGTDQQIVLDSPAGRPLSWQTLIRQRGFAVLLATDALAMGGVLVEGAHGRGRFLLSSLALDKQFRNGQVVAPPSLRSFAATFFQNLRRYIESVREGTAALVEITTPAELSTPGSWAIAVLPDTQNYVDFTPASKPQLFRSQTEWIVQNRATLDIRFVLHLGDITQTNAPAEWELARNIMDVLDGEVPYAAVGGNHDYGAGGTALDRTTFFSNYFPPEKFAGSPSFGGVMESGKIDNSYHLFEVAGQKWLVMALEWSPRDKVVSWAGSIIAANLDRRVIIITHAYLDYDNTRFDWATKGGSQMYTPHLYPTGRDPEGANDGEELWKKLVSRYSNVALVVNGHVLNDGRGFLASTGAGGRVVNQMLVNFQTRHDGGDGYLRILEVLPDQRTVRVRDYSPALDSYYPGRKSNFFFALEPDPTAGTRQIEFAPPTVLNVTAGSTVVLAPQVAGLGAVRSQQWKRDGALISGASSGVLLIPNFKVSDSATYTLEVTGVDGGRNVWPARVEYGTQPSRLSNVSARGWVGARGADLTLGVVARSQVDSTLLLRAIGPGLERFGIGNFLRDPRLSIVDARLVQIAINDNWGEQTTPADVVDSALRLGASALVSGSKDAAVNLAMPIGSLIARCASADGGEGVGLVELFDIAGDARPTSVFKNISAQGSSVAGERVLTLGFIVAGGGSRTLLIRGVGPTLETFGVDGTLKDPVVSLFDQSGRLVAVNDDWGENDRLFPIGVFFERVGAFPLKTASRDSALLVTVAAGAYTIQVLGKNAGSGTVLIELYDLD